MTLYEIFWYPDCPMDCEKQSSMVLCNNIREAWQIADKYFKKVVVSEICDYPSIAGGNQGEEYWANLVMYKGEVMGYETYKELKNAE